MDYISACVTVCLLVGFAGFVDAIAGGGGIISLPAYMLTGIPAHYAYGSNKFSSAIGTTFSAGRFFVNGALDVKVALLSAAGAFFGSTAGSKIVTMLDDQVLKTMLVIVLPLVAVFLLFKRDFGGNDVNRVSELSAVKTVLFALLIGFLIGGYDGIFGPGTGTFAIIAYSILMKYDLKTASGNAKILNLASNYAAVITFAREGTIDYRLAIPAAVCGIIGNFLGSGFAIKKGAKVIRPMMIFVIVLLLGKMVFDILI